MRQLKNFRSGDKPTDNESEKQTVLELNDKFSGMNENELMGELMSRVSNAKRDGSFSELQLDEFVNFVSPSLDDKSRARLNELVRALKG